MKKLLVVQLCIILWLAMLVGLVVLGVHQFNANKAMVGDFLTAEYAHIRAGKAVPFTDPTYANSHSQTIWGIETNSQWLIDWTTKIVPAIVYENASVGDGIYPSAVIFIPYAGIRSFHIGGSTISDYLVVFVNERYLTDPSWNDEREVLATLVHELVHVQGFTFVNGEPEQFEAFTQAATLETLAGMCNYKTPLACSAFWNETQTYARVSFRLELNKRGLDWLYDPIANILWREPSDIPAAAKSERYWATDPEGLAYIDLAYYQAPWEIILDGTNHNQYLSTGMCIPGPTCYIQLMPFDDSRALLRPILWILYWIK